MTHAVYCICSSEHQANSILTGLRNAGPHFEISVLLQEHANTRNISVNEDVARGATIGGVVGALLALAIPGIGAALAVGPLVAALGGATAGGAVGGLAGGSGAFTPLGLPEDVTRRLESHIGKGGILIAVHSDNAAALATAERICKSGGAEDVYRDDAKVA